MNVTTDQLLGDFHALTRALAESQAQRDQAAAITQQQAAKIVELEARLVAEAEKAPANGNATKAVRERAGKAA